MAGAGGADSGVSNRPGLNELPPPFPLELIFLSPAFCLRRPIPLTAVLKLLQADNADVGDEVPGVPKRNAKL